ncbi:MAG: archease [Deltaproteobacteria bacterium]|nr:archease [Deltaproteobacteria bacterium]
MHLVKDPGTYRFAPHTGEVLLRVGARDVPGLFVEAASALAELQAGASLPKLLDRSDVVELEAPDVEALLVAWLDELIYLGDVHGHVYTRFDLERCTTSSLRAVVFGGVPGELRTQVKAATFHRLRVDASGPRCSAELVLDV